MSLLCKCESAVYFMNQNSLNIGNVVGIVSKNSLKYIQAVFDAYSAGDVVVLLKSASDCARIDQFKIKKVIDPENTFGWMNKSFDLPIGNSIAQVSFTSGTEAEPKGVILTHDSLSNVTARLNSIMEVNESIREYVGVPVNYSFGLGRCRAIASIGGDFFIPENGFNPLEIRQMLLDNEINSISAVPSLWRVLLMGKSIFGNETDRVRWIEIGSQFMSADEKIELKKLFKNAVIVQHYGLTEASRTTLLRIDKATKKQLESVGRAYGDTTIRIADDGRIRIKGGHVASQIIVRDGVVNNTDENGWLQTNDLGRIEDGFLFYLGRADDLINCGGIKLSPDAIEAGIKSTCQINTGLAVAGFADLAFGDVVLVCYKKESLQQKVDVFKTRVHDVLLQLGLSNKSAIRFFEVLDFPVTDTGKVRRKELAALYGRAAVENSNGITVSDISSIRVDSSSSMLTPKQAEIAAIWSDILNIKNIDIDNNFYDLGGNSLSALLAIIDMEKNNVPSAISKGMLQGLSIRQIAVSMGESTDVPKDVGRKIVYPVSSHANMTINAVRGFLALCVVFAHWSAGFMDRLPVSLSWIESSLSPLLAIGTPGFSIIYGVSAGYTFFSAYKLDRERFRSIQKKTLLILTLGIALNGVVFLMEAISKKGGVTATEFFNSFYSVLTYYWLITASLGLIFGALEKRSQTISFVILLAIVSYCVDQVVFLPLGALQSQGFLEFLKLLFTAKYAYFNMLSGTAAGLAVGIWLGRKDLSSNPYGAMLPVGIACILLGLMISYHAADLHNWLVWPVSTNKIWRWITYVGVIFLLVHFFKSAFSIYVKLAVVNRYILQFLVVCGILAFPIFVLHELVIPIKNVMIALSSVNSGVALAIGLTICFVPFFLMYKRIYNVSFS